MAYGGAVGSERGSPRAYWIMITKHDIKISEQLLLNIFIQLLEESKSIKTLYHTCEVLPIERQSVEHERAREPVHEHYQGLEK